MFGIGDHHHHDHHHFGMGDHHHHGHHHFGMGDHHHHGHHHFGMGDHHHHGHHHHDPVSHAVQDIIEGAFFGGGHSHHHHHCDGGGSSMAFWEQQRRDTELARQRQEAAAQKEREEQQFIAETMESGLNALRDKNFTRAVSQFSTLAQRLPTHSEAQDGLKRAHEGMGDDYLKQNRIFDALEEYVKADSQSGVNKALRQLLNHITVCEGQLSSADITLLSQLNEINGELVKAKNIIGEKYTAPSLFSKLGAIQIKIGRCETRIQHAKAAALIEEANRQLESMGDEIPSPYTKEEAIAVCKELNAIEEKYTKARSLNPTSPAAQIQKLESLQSQAKLHLNQFLRAESLSYMEASHKTLLTLNLMDHSHLDRIAVTCTGWLESHKKLSKISPTDSEAAMGTKTNIEAIQKEVERAQESLASLPDLVVQIVQDTIKKTKHANGKLSTSETTRIRDEWHQIIVQNPHFHNHWITLTADGLAHIENKIGTLAVEALKKKTYLIGLSFGKNTYLINCTPFITQSLFKQWYNDARQLGTVQSIPDRFKEINPPPYSAKA
jgi:hypothetical protein